MSGGPFDNPQDKPDRSDSALNNARDMLDHERLITEGREGIADLAVRRLTDCENDGVSVHQPQPPSSSRLRRAMRRSGSGCIGIRTTRENTADDVRWPRRLSRQIRNANCWQANPTIPEGPTTHRRSSAVACSLSSAEPIAYFHRRCAHRKRRGPCFHSACAASTAVTAASYSCRIMLVSSGAFSASFFNSSRFAFPFSTRPSVYHIFAVSRSRAT